MQEDDLKKHDGISGQPKGVTGDGLGETGSAVDASGDRVADVAADDNTGKGTMNSIWLDMLALIGVFAVANIIGGFIGVIMNKSANADPEFSMFVSYVTAFGLTIAFALWQRIRRSAHKPLLRLSLKNANPGLILWGLILVIVTSVVLEPLLNIFPAEYLENLQKAIGTGGWAIMTSIVAAPILEEVLFRGIVQESLTQKLGGWRGVLAASAIFGIVHVIPQQMINAFFIGLILGYIYIKTRSVLPVILIHAINNAIAFIQMIVFGDDGLMTVREVISNDIIYWIVYGLFCVIFLVSIVGLWQRLKKLPANVAVKGLGRKRDRIIVESE